MPREGAGGVAARLGFPGLVTLGEAVVPKEERRGVDARVLLDAEIRLCDVAQEEVTAAANAVDKGRLVGRSSLASHNFSGKREGAEVSFVLSPLPSMRRSVTLVRLGKAINAMGLNPQSYTKRRLNFFLVWYGMVEVCEGAPVAGAAGSSPILFSSD